MIPDVAACEEIIHAALRAGDMKTVEAALIVMAPQDPHRADELRHALLFAAELAGECAS